MVASPLRTALGWRPASAFLCRVSSGKDLLGPYMSPTSSGRAAALSWAREGLTSVGSMWTNHDLPLHLCLASMPAWEGQGQRETLPHTEAGLRPQCCFRAGEKVKAVFMQTYGRAKASPRHPLAARVLGAFSDVRSVQRPAGWQVAALRAGPFPPGQRVPRSWEALTWAPGPTPELPLLQT